MFNYRQDLALSWPQQGQLAVRFRHYSLTFDLIAQYRKIKADNGTLRLSFGRKSARKARAELSRYACDCVSLGGRYSPALSQKWCYTAIRMAPIACVVRKVSRGVEVPLDSLLTLGLTGFIQTWQ